MIMYDLHKLFDWFSLSLVIFLEYLNIVIYSNHLEISFENGYNYLLIFIYYIIFYVKDLFI